MFCHISNTKLVNLRETSVSFLFALLFFSLNYPSMGELSSWAAPSCPRGRGERAVALIETTKTVRFYLDSSMKFKWRKFSMRRLHDLLAPDRGKQSCLYFRIPAILGTWSCRHRMKIAINRGSVCACLIANFLGRHPLSMSRDLLFRQ